ncbi:transcription-repair coupling factor [Pantoea sp. SoEX]|uniref:transcription-repair coupling factor n=1 Tax=Pantoea sp. SoEX TaxID=2576763 RepID=UPI00135B494D|nr:transcription-repair coupling factor [Pantoea sp. SoEX]MXP50994.1 transcription-repair coupling factor [Pantoea sp. SoEX]
MFKKNNYLLPKKAGEIYNFGELVGTSYAIEYANIIENYFGFILIITSDKKTATQLFNEIKQFTKSPVYYFPDWEIAPYTRSSPNKKNISNRIFILSQLLNIKHGILILSVKTLMQRICPCPYISSNSLLIKEGQKLSKDYFKNKLEKIGYRYVNQIVEQGEYRIKKDVFFDLFPIGYNQIYSINLIKNIVNNISNINLHNQKFVNKVIKIHLLPTHEFPVDKVSIELFCKRWKNFFDISTHEEYYINKNMNIGIIPAGIEYWYPLFFDQPLSTIFSYLPSNTTIINHNNIEDIAIDFWENINRYYKNISSSSSALLNPSHLWITPRDMIQQLNHWPQIKVTDKKLPQKPTNINLGYIPLPLLNLRELNRFSLKNLDKFINQFNGNVIFCVQNKIQQKKFYNLFEHLNLKPVLIDNFNESVNQKLNLMIINISNGFIDTNNNRALICDNDIVQDNFNDCYPNIKKCSNFNKIIFNVEEIRYGQPVVHIEHGIGRYMGLITIETNGINSEYLILSYADNTKLYVPVSSLHLVSYYTSHSDDKVPIHKLGSDVWQKSRQKAIEKIRDVAAELLDIYCQRKSKIGYAFKYNKNRYKSFCNHFPYNVTVDQQKAINEILNDMSLPIAMDRLVCGDVGFGKTEVAMHAAFIAIENNKQVAILVPTNLLAQQHYENFKSRFRHWSVHIDMLSNFRNIKQQKHLLEKTKEGKVNIVIGTHKLLNKNIKWKNLGLLIIDEEHRFGVYQKELIKAIYNNIDILTLTATPIPRTLHMAITGMRDVSIIHTPPEHRLPIKTFISEFSNSIIRETILREIKRGGQVYYLHNKVNDIEKTAHYISKLVPEACITIAHGKMKEQDLERVMNDFYHQHFNVLVCTTIIETGIDIPNANTIIIERADTFGLAELHQLRGRVGRSHHQAYAWLLTPNQEIITNKAVKRFDVISSFKELGAGFTLANSDLEIRGAGELLGEKQSGQIEMLGFSLYMELLENAIKDLKNFEQPQLLDNLLYNNIEIELQIPSLIPEYFIENVNLRLSLYKKIASAKNKYDIQKLKNEMIGNFGLLPNATNNLFDIALLRLQARELGICKIKIGYKGGYFDFSPKNNIDPVKLVNLIQKEPTKWKLTENKKLRLYCNDIIIEDQKYRIEWIKKFFISLTNK